MGVGSGGVSVVGTVRTGLAPPFFWRTIPANPASLPTRLFQTINRVIIDHWTLHTVYRYHPGIDKLPVGIVRGKRKAASMVALLKEGLTTEEKELGYGYFFEK